ncbi:MAG: hydroxymethylbilane synthase, partial [Gaiellaceae bacterium]
VEAERAVVATIGGGCLAPIAAHHDGATLTGLVADEDGTWLERRIGEDAKALGRELAALLAARDA